MPSITGATYLIKHLRKRKKKIYRCYEERNERVSELIGRYTDYLASPEWREIRTRRLAADPACFLCGRPADQVHHTDYDWDTLLGQCDRALVCLCRNCHGSLEVGPDGGKRRLDEANDLLCVGLEQRIRQAPDTHAQLWLQWFKHRRRTAASRQRKLEKAQQRRASVSRKHRRLEMEQHRAVVRDSRKQGRPPQPTPKKD